MITRLSLGGQAVRNRNRHPLWHGKRRYERIVHVRRFVDTVTGQVFLEVVHASEKLAAVFTRAGIGSCTAMGTLMGLEVVLPPETFAAAFKQAGEGAFWRIEIGPGVC